MGLPQDSVMDSTSFATRRAGPNAGSSLRRPCDLERVPIAFEPWFSSSVGQDSLSPFRVPLVSPGSETLRRGGVESRSCWKTALLPVLCEKPKKVKLVSQVGGERRASMCDRKPRREERWPHTGRGPEVMGP